MRWIEIPDEVAVQFDALARETGIDSAGLIREALLLRLEEMEDAGVEMERLRSPGKRISLDEVGRQLGLDD